MAPLYGAARGATAGTYHDPPLPEQTELQRQNRGVTFNVVFTPGSPARLLPFSLSLLQSPSVRVRVVANGCDPREIALMRAAAETDERLSHYVLQSAHPIEHGLALNHLFETFPEPRFAFVDSDVIATGDFMRALSSLAPGQVGVFTAPPVWMTDDEAVSIPGSSILSGRRRRLQDGTFVGNTYCAIYERAVVEPVWRAAPRGFALHHKHRLPRSVRASLAARGWRFRTLDTARLINLQLLLAGFKLENRRVPELHHLGGFSVRHFQGTRGGMRRLVAVLRSSSDGRLRRLADGILNRFYFRIQNDPSRRRKRQHRWEVLFYIDEVLDAILAGEPTPRALRTDSAEVDRRVAELVAALETQYPRGVASLREANQAPLPGVGAD